MPYGDRPDGGQILWSNLNPITVANSPLLSPWLSTDGYRSVIPWFVFAGGTSTNSLEASLDGTNVDADLAVTLGASGVSVELKTPFFRWKTVQTVADATKSKVVLRALA